MGERSPEAGGPSPSGVGFFFDKSVGKRVPAALALLGVNAIAHDTVYEARKSIDDETWIEYACSKNLIIVKRDKNIRRNPAERAAFIRHRARAFLLGGNDSRLQMMRSLMIAWPEILMLSDATDPPFIYFIDNIGRIGQRVIRDTD